MFSGRRRGLSEVVGTVLVAAMTIIAGAAIFGYVNGQAGIASQAYGQSVGNNVQYLEEKFTVVDMSWTNSTSFTVWIYNTGQIQLSLLQVRFFGTGSTGALNILYNYTGTANRIHDLLNLNTQACNINAGKLESPPILSFSAKETNTQTIAISIPSAVSGCSSFGQSLVPGDTYTIVVSGSYGNSFTYSEVY